MMDILNGIRWQTAGMKAKEIKSLELTMKNVLMEEPIQSYPLLANGPKLKPRWDVHLSGDDDQPGYAGESLSSVLGE